MGYNPKHKAGAIRRKNLSFSFRAGDRPIYKKIASGVNTP